MSRTIVITGAASGIGKATAERLRTLGHRVIGVDLHGSDVDTDLGTAQGRADMVAMVTALAPDGIDGVVAAAGIARPDAPRETIAINYFGAVATLDGLRPLLARSSSPRAVAICSTSVMLPGNRQVVDLCLAHDEPAALEAIAAAPHTAYVDSKTALSLWLRKTSVQPEWAGAGLLLNGVAPGVTNTPMNATMALDPDHVALVKQTTPIAVQDYAKPEEIAELIGFLLQFEAHYLLGQIIFMDGGTDALVRPTHF